MEKLKISTEKNCRKSHFSY